MKTTGSNCSVCGTTDNLETVTLYGGEEMTLCNDCLSAKYTGCAVCGIFFRDDEDDKLSMRDEHAGDVVCIFCRPRKFIDACDNIKDLCDTLNLIESVGANDGNNIDYCDLPTFGKEPVETAEKFSWDDEYLMVKLNSLNPWELIKRDDI
jgi:hypothetical protein